MGQIETGFFVSRGTKFFPRFNETRKTLQAVKVDIKLYVDLLLSLESFVKNLRDRYTEFESELIKSLVINRIKLLCRDNEKNKRLDLDVGNTRTESVVLTCADKFRTETFLVITDRLIVALKHRIVAHQTVYMINSEHCWIRCNLNLCSQTDLPKNTRRTCPKNCSMVNWCNGAPSQN
jgi:hypothetical protein